jgi:hypothetical protein
MQKFFAAALVAVAVFAGPALAQGVAEPVLVGGDDLDACPSLGQVVNLNPGGDNFLAVRSGPGTNFAQIGTLHSGNTAFVCDQFEGWFGVVFGENCGVSSPIVPRAPYAGPCGSGWVSTRYLEIIAG